MSAATLDRTTKLSRTYLGDSTATKGERRTAVGICLTLALLSVLASACGANEGPRLIAFIPIATTIWGLADFTTAFLLFAQFYVSGKHYLATLAAAYTLSGTLSLLYLVTFPGIFWLGSMPLAAQQLVTYASITWHTTFPLICISAVILHRRLRVPIGKPLRLAALRYSLGGTVLLCALVVFILWVGCGWFPVIIFKGTFQPVLRFVFTPICIVINLAALWVIAKDWTRISTLDLGLTVVVTASLLDLFLNMNGSGRFSYSWYAGKFDTLVTANVILLMIMFNMTILYARLEDIAMIDPLTGLENRRALDDHTQTVIALAKRKPTSLAALLIDIDFFKRVNDQFGHAGGDAVLVQVARSLKFVAQRPIDMVARRGGEEFMVLLPDTSYDGAKSVAETARELVGRTPYVAEDGVVLRVTISIGVAFVATPQQFSATEIFNCADAALYEAKNSGRNRVFVSRIAKSEPLLAVM